MAVPIPLGYLRSRSASGNRMDVVLQSRTSKYGIGRIHPKTAAGHGRIALLLLSTVKNGGITVPLLWARAAHSDRSRASATWEPLSLSFKGLQAKAMQYR